MPYSDPDCKSNKPEIGERGGRSASTSIMTGRNSPLAGGAALDLERRLSYRFSIISSMVMRAVASMYGPKYGLLAPNWKAMAAIGRYGPMSAKDVCACTTVEPDKVTRAVDRLVALRYVQRTKDRLDRRRVVLLLTPAGRKVYEDIEHATRRIELLLLDALSAQERAELDRITTKLQDQARKHIGDKLAWNRIIEEHGRAQKRMLAVGQSAKPVPRRPAKAVKGPSRRTRK